jgi:hypothetical protein
MKGSHRPVARDRHYKISLAAKSFFNAKRLAAASLRKFHLLLPVSFS